MLLIFLYIKKEIQLELKEILFTNEWCGKCPAPLGTAYDKRLLMQMYIPHEFKQVCQKYIHECWDKINEYQKERLEQ
jgi:hypothetical protein